MSTINGHANGAIAKPTGLLEPLPTLKLVPSVEKLDAGLRSLDHCVSGLNRFTAAH